LSLIVALSGLLAVSAVADKEHSNDKIQLWPLLNALPQRIPRRVSFWCPMKRYTEEFKAEAVRLALESGMSRSRVARDLGVNLNSLSAWIKKALQEGGAAAETVEQENRRLRRENARITQERDILKKAVGIPGRAGFSKELR
jgi:transposase